MISNSGIAYCRHQYWSRFLILDFSSQSYSSMNCTGLSEGGDAEPPWALRNNLWSLLICRMTSKQGMEMEWRRLGDVVRGAETVSRGWSFCLSGDSEGHFARVMAALHQCFPSLVELTITPNLVLNNWYLGFEQRSNQRLFYAPLQRSYQVLAGSCTFWIESTNPYIL